MGEENSRTRLESELKGKALQIYWYMLGKGGPIGVREVQRSLGFSSPSVAHHHLEKLSSLGVVQQDEFGRYVLAQRVEVGVLQAFTRVGSIMLPRFTFYAVFFTTLLAMYVVLYPQSLNVFALAFGVVASIFSWYETVRVWRRRPF